MGRLLFSNYSSSPNGASASWASWATDIEAMRARGTMVFVKSNQLVKKYIGTKHLSPKHSFGRQNITNRAGAFTYGLLVAQPIRTQH